MTGKGKGKRVSIHIYTGVDDEIYKIAKKFDEQDFAGMFNSNGEANRSGVLNALVLIASGRKNEIARKSNAEK